MKRTKTFCDRCLNECKEGQSITLINVIDFDDIDVRWDLCMDCYNEFKNVFMAEKKSEMMAEKEDQPCPPMTKGD